MDFSAEVHEHAEGKVCLKISQMVQNPKKIIFGLFKSRVL
jgi:hypothetical protein